MCHNLTYQMPYDNGSGEARESSAEQPSGGAASAAAAVPVAGALGIAPRSPPPHPARAHAALWPAAVPLPFGCAG